MRDISTLDVPNTKVRRTYNVKPITRDVISQHAHVYYNGNESMCMDYIIQEWRELRAAKEQGRIKVVNP